MITTMTKMVTQMVQILGKLLLQQQSGEITREAVAEGSLAKVVEGGGADFGDVVEGGAVVGGEGGAVVGGEGEGEVRRGEEVVVVNLSRDLSEANKRVFVSHS